jgi:hypothetical protein
MEVRHRLHAPVALPRGTATGTHFIGGWVGPGNGLDAMEKRRILATDRNRTQIPLLPACSQVAIPNELYIGGVEITSNGNGYSDLNPTE